MAAVDERAAALAALGDMVRELFHDSHAALRQIVSGLTVEQLDWRPVAGANSIGALIAHALDAERFLVAGAADVTLERDREAQFRVARQSAADYVARIDEIEAETDAFLANLRPDLLASTIVHGPRVHPGAWWLLHPLEHEREHVGQALLTRQLLEERDRASR